MGISLKINKKKLCCIQNVTQSLDHFFNKSLYVGNQLCLLFLGRWVGEPDGICGRLPDVE